MNLIHLIQVANKTITPREARFILHSQYSLRSLHVKMPLSFQVSNLTRTAQLKHGREGLINMLFLQIDNKYVINLQAPDK